MWARGNTSPRMTSGRRRDAEAKKKKKKKKTNSVKIKTQSREIETKHVQFKRKQVLSKNNGGNGTRNERAPTINSNFVHDMNFSVWIR